MSLLSTFQQGTIYSGDLEDTIKEDYFDDPTLTDKVKQAYKDFLEECASTFDDWKYGMTLITSDYWPEYAKEYAAETVQYFYEDEWPFSHIDWDAAASELQYSFSHVEFHGETLWGM